MPPRATAWLRGSPRLSVPARPRSVFFTSVPPRKAGQPRRVGITRSRSSKAARAAGLYARNVNGDAFSVDIKAPGARCCSGPTSDRSIWSSIPSPLRGARIRNTGTVHKSVLKPIGAPYTNKTVDTDKGIVSDVTIEPATEQEIADTTAVMGGEDWELWMNALSEGNLLAPGAQSVAYSYIGPDVTWPIYKNGTIGLAKNDLERAARNIDSLLTLKVAARLHLRQQGVVTQASSAIPSCHSHSISTRSMKGAPARGLHRVMQRLFATTLFMEHAEVRRSRSACASTIGRCAPKFRSVRQESGRASPRIPRAETDIAGIAPSF